VFICIVRFLPTHHINFHERPLTCKNAAEAIRCARPPFANVPLHLRQKRKICAKQRNSFRSIPHRPGGWCLECARRADGPRHRSWSLLPLASRSASRSDVIRSDSARCTTSSNRLFSPRPTASVTVGSTPAGPWRRSGLIVRCGGGRIGTTMAERTVRPRTRLRQVGALMSKDEGLPRATSGNATATARARALADEPSHSDVFSGLGNKAVTLPVSWAKKPLFERRPPHSPHQPTCWFTQKMKTMVSRTTLCIWCCHPSCYDYGRLFGQLAGPEQ